MLTGLRIVITRAAHQAEELAAPLRALGAEVIALPVIAILPPPDIQALRRAAEEADSYDWIVFSSANGVRFFCEARPDRAAPLRPAIAVVGAATKDAAEAHDLRVAITPERYVAESLLEQLAGYNWQGRRVLIPRAAVARDLIPDELRRRGAQVDVVEAYRNSLPPEAPANARHVFQPPYPDWVLFASTSAVENLVRLAGAETLKHSRLASIGPVTSAALRKLDLPVAAEAEPHTVHGLVAAINNFRMGS